MQPCLNYVSFLAYPPIKHSPLVTDGNETQCAPGYCWCDAREVDVCVCDVRDMVCF